MALPSAREQERTAMTATQRFQSWRGLSEQEAASRLLRFGPNLVHEPRSRSVREILRETLREPMFLLLTGAATLYLFIGDLAEGLFLTGGALLSLALVIVQRSRTERALRTLNALAEPRTRVIREGKVRTISARELVPGDLVLVEEGGRVQADSVLVDGDALEVDESALTGESNPCLKTPSSLPPGDYEIPAPGEEVSSALYAATLVVRGQGVAQTPPSVAQRAAAVVPRLRVNGRAQARSYSAICRSRPAGD